MARSLDQDLVEDLTIRPNYPEWSTSISHCGKTGAWVAIARPAAIGLDIDRLERITERIVRRVSLDREVRAAPDARYLWCAKEAAFKANASRAPVTISSIRIESWRAIPSAQAYSFRTQFGDQGWLVLSGPLVLALCIASV